MLAHRTGDFGILMRDVLEYDENFYACPIRWELSGQVLQAP